MRFCVFAAQVIDSVRYTTSDNIGRLSQLAIPYDEIITFLARAMQDSTRSACYWGPLWSEKGGSDVNYPVPTNRPSSKGCPQLVALSALKNCSVSPELTLRLDYFATEHMHLGCASINNLKNSRTSRKLCRGGMGPIVFRSDWC